MTCHITFQPLGRRVAAAEGATVLAIAQSAGIPLTSVCGGRKTCGRCRVRVVSGRASPLSDGERDRLSEDEIAAGFRLACSTQILGDLKIDIPATSLPGIQRIQLFGEGPELVPDPVISAYDLDLSECSPNVPVTEWAVIESNMGELHGLQNLRPDSRVLEELPLILRESGGRVTALVRNDELVGVQPRGRELLGVAIDLGTTTIAAYLVNLRTGENLATLGTMNPQIAYGEDVMSRISYAMEGGADKLRDCVLEALNKLIREMVGDHEDVAEVAMVGNTAMHHLLLGLPVKQLGTAPYAPALRRSLSIKARDIGLQVAPGAYVHFLPIIGGFVGADHVSMLLATGICEARKTVIGIDIGTNTEITLAAKGTLTSLSCASGPAFEGGGISHGMRAISGAIEKVTINDHLVQFKVIGDVRPIGICGSGILDAVSEFRRWQVLDSRGRFLAHPLVRRGKGGPSFVLASNDITGTGHDIVVTQRDVGEIQLAKAAIRAGISVLCGEAGIGENDIDEVIVAGAFGHHMNLDSAVRIGLLPRLPLDRFRQVGNAAGAGAKLALISRRHRAGAEEIVRRVRYLELTTHSNFTQHFSHALRFP